MDPGFSEGGPGGGEGLTVHDHGKGEGAGGGCAPPMAEHETFAINFVANNK